MLNTGGDQPVYELVEEQQYPLRCNPGGVHWRYLLRRGIRVRPLMEREHRFRCCCDHFALLGLCADHHPAAGSAYRSAIVGWRVADSLVLLLLAG